MPAWNLREMANTARKRALSGVARRVADCPLDPCVGLFGARLSDSPIGPLVWLTGGLASATRACGVGGVERKAHYLAVDLPQSDDCFVMGFPSET